MPPAVSGAKVSEETCHLCQGSVKQMNAQDIFKWFFLFKSKEVIYYFFSVIVIGKKWRSNTGWFCAETISLHWPLLTLQAIFQSPELGGELQAKYPPSLTIHSGVERRVHIL